MLKGISRELLESFNLFEADNPDGTDNDDGEKVLPSDVQHGFKSKIKSKDVINPLLQELEIKNNLVEPIKVDESLVSYRKNIDGKYVDVSFFDEDYLNIWDLSFTVNDQFSSNKNSKIMFQVYQFVFDCLFSFIQTYEPKGIKFNAFVEKQDEIYNLFLKQLSSNINKLGYDISKNDIYYILKRREESLTELKISDNDISPSNTKLTNGISTFEYNTKIEDDEVKVLITLEPDDYASIGFSVNLSTNIPASGNKNSMKIYNFVISSIYSFIKEYSPKGLYFVGASDKHEEIYNTLGKLLQRDLKSKGYILIQDEFSGLYVISKDNDLEEMKKYAGL